MMDSEERTTSAAAALPEGEFVAGRYRIERVLGQGSFGITYEVWDKKRKIRAALKEYFPQTCAERTAGEHGTAIRTDAADDYDYGKECFLEEASKLKVCIHVKNIAHVYDVFEENGTAYFSMEYVDGISLSEYVHQHGGALTYEEAGSLLFPVMDALTALHTAGIVHGDVNPDDILITADGTSVLVDFGNARYRMGGRSRTLRLTLRDGYAPKELYLRDGKPDAQTDEYGAAAAMYYALTGEAPASFLERSEEDVRQRPSQRGASLKMEYDAAIGRALSAKKTDRFADVAGLKTALGGASDEGEDAAGAGSRSRMLYQSVLADQDRLKQRICTAVMWIVTLICAFLMVLSLLNAVQGQTGWGSALLTAVPCLIAGVLVCPLLSKYIKGNEKLTLIRIPVAAAALAFILAGVSGVWEPAEDLDISDGSSYVYQDSFVFQISDGNAVINGYIGTDTVVEVPESIGGYPVTEIGGSAFSDCRNITEIVLPEGITQIDNYAFYGCCMLETITLPDTIVSIGNSAFNGCRNLTSVDIPEGVTLLLENTFYECRSLETIVLPDGLTYIGEQAFYFCALLPELQIPDSVTDIGQYAFYNCRSLTQIIIPDGVKSLENYTFYNCENLTQVSVPADCVIEDYAFSQTGVKAVYRREAG